MAAGAPPPSGGIYLSSDDARALGMQIHSALRTGGGGAADLKGTLMKLLGNAQGQAQAPPHAPADNVQMVIRSVSPRRSDVVQPADPHVHPPVHGRVHAVTPEPPVVAAQPQPQYPAISTAAPPPLPYTGYPHVQQPPPQWQPQPQPAHGGSGPWVPRSSPAAAAAYTGASHPVSSAPPAHSAAAVPAYHSGHPVPQGAAPYGAAPGAASPTPHTPPPGGVLPGHFPAHAAQPPHLVDDRSASAGGGYQRASPNLISPRSASLAYSTPSAKGEREAGGGDHRRRVASITPVEIPVNTAHGGGGGGVRRGSHASTQPTKSAGGGRSHEPPSTASTARSDPAWVHDPTGGMGHCPVKSDYGVADGPPSPLHAPPSDVASPPNSPSQARRPPAKHHPLTAAQRVVPPSAPMPTPTDERTQQYYQRAPAPRRGRGSPQGALQGGDVDDDGGREHHGVGEEYNNYGYGDDGGDDGGGRRSYYEGGDPRSRGRGPRHDGDEDGGPRIEHRDQHQHPKHKRNPRYADAEDLEEEDGVEEGAPHGHQQPQQQHPRRGTASTGPAGALRNSSSRSGGSGGGGGGGVTWAREGSAYRPMVPANSMYDPTAGGASEEDPGSQTPHGVLDLSTTVPVEQMETLMGKPSDLDGSMSNFEAVQVGIGVPPGNVVRVVSVASTGASGDDDGGDRDASGPPRSARAGRGGSDRQQQHRPHASSAYSSHVGYVEGDPEGAGPRDPARHDHAEEYPTHASTPRGHSKLAPKGSVGASMYRPLVPHNTIVGGMAVGVGGRGDGDNVVGEDAPAEELEMEMPERQGAGGGVGEGGGVTNTARGSSNNSQLASSRRHSARWSQHGGGAGTTSGNVTGSSSHTSSGGGGGDDGLQQTVVRADAPPGYVPEAYNPASEAQSTQSIITPMSAHSMDDAFDAVDRRRSSAGGGGGGGAPVSAFTSHGGLSGREPSNAPLSSRASRRTPAQHPSSADAVAAADESDVSEADAPQRQPQSQQQHPSGSAAARRLSSRGTQGSGGGGGGAGESTAGDHLAHWEAVDDPRHKSHTSASAGGMSRKPSSSSASRAGMAKGASAAGGQLAHWEETGEPQTQLREASSRSRVSQHASQPQRHNSDGQGTTVMHGSTGNQSSQPLRGTRQPSSRSSRVAPGASVHDADAYSVSTDVETSPDAARPLQTPCDDGAGTRHGHPMRGRRRLSSQMSGPLEGRDGDGQTGGGGGGDGDDDDDDDTTSAHPSVATSSHPSVATSSHPSQHIRRPSSRASRGGGGESTAGDHLAHWEAVDDPRHKSHTSASAGGMSRKPSSSSASRAGMAKGASAAGGQLAHWEETGEPHTRVRRVSSQAQPPSHGSERERSGTRRGSATTARTSVSGSSHDSEEPSATLRDAEGSGAYGDRHNSTAVSSRPPHSRRHSSTRASAPHSTTEDDVEMLEAPLQRPSSTRMSRRTSRAADSELVGDAEADDPYQPGGAGADHDPEPMAAAVARHALPSNEASLGPRRGTVVSAVSSRPPRSPREGRGPPQRLPSRGASVHEPSDGGRRRRGSSYREMPADADADVGAEEDEALYHDDDGGSDAHSESLGARHHSVAVSSHAPESRRQSSTRQPQRRPSSHGGEEEGEGAYDDGDDVDDGARRLSSRRPSSRGLRGAVQEYDDGDGNGGYGDHPSRRSSSARASRASRQPSGADRGDAEWHDEEDNPGAVRAHSSRVSSQPPRTRSRGPSSRVSSVRPRVQGEKVYEEDDDYGAVQPSDLVMPGGRRVSSTRRQDDSARRRPSSRISLAHPRSHPAGGRGRSDVDEDDNEEVMQSGGRRASRASRPASSAYRETDPRDDDTMYQEEGADDVVVGVASSTHGHRRPPSSIRQPSRVSRGARSRASSGVEADGGDVYDDDYDDTVGLHEGRRPSVASSRPPESRGRTPSSKVSRPATGRSEGGDGGDGDSGGGHEFDDGVDDDYGAYHRPDSRPRSSRGQRPQSQHLSSRPHSSFGGPAAAAAGSIGRRASRRSTAGGEYDERDPEQHTAAHDTPQYPPSRHSSSSNRGPPRGGHAPLSAHTATTADGDGDSAGDAGMVALRSSQQSGRTGNRSRDPSGSTYRPAVPNNSEGDAESGFPGVGQVESVGVGFGAYDSQGMSTAAARLSSSGRVRGAATAQPSRADDGDGGGIATPLSARSRRMSTRGGRTTPAERQESDVDTSLSNLRHVQFSSPRMVSVVSSAGEVDDDEDPHHHGSAHDDDAGGGGDGASSTQSPSRRPGFGSRSRSTALPTRSQLSRTPSRGVPRAESARGASEADDGGEEELDPRVPGGRVVRAMPSAAAAGDSGPSRVGNSRGSSGAPPRRESSQFPPRSTSAANPSGGRNTPLSVRTAESVVFDVFETDGYGVPAPDADVDVDVDDDGTRSTGTAAAGGSLYRPLAPANTPRNGLGSSRHSTGGRSAAERPPPVPAQVEEQQVFVSSPQAGSVPTRKESDADAMGYRPTRSSVALQEPQMPSGVGSGHSLPGRATPPLQSSVYRTSSGAPLGASPSSRSGLVVSPTGSASAAPHPPQNRQSVSPTPPDFPGQGYGVTSTAAAAAVAAAPISAAPVASNTTSMPMQLPLGAPSIYPAAAPMEVMPSVMGAGGPQSVRPVSSGFSGQPLSAVPVQSMPLSSAPPNQVSSPTYDIGMHLRSQGSMMSQPLPSQVPPVQPTPEDISSFIHHIADTVFDRLQSTPGATKKQVERTVTAALMEHLAPAAAAAARSQPPAASPVHAAANMPAHHSAPAPSFDDILRVVSRSVHELERGSVARASSGQLPLFPSVSTFVSRHPALLISGYPASAPRGNPSYLPDLPQPGVPVSQMAYARYGGSRSRLRSGPRPYAPPQVPFPSVAPTSGVPVSGEVEGLLSATLPVPAASSYAATLQPDSAMYPMQPQPRVSYPVAFAPQDSRDMGTSPIGSSAAGAGGGDRSVPPPPLPSGAGSLRPQSALPRRPAPPLLKQLSGETAASCVTGGRDEAQPPLKLDSSIWNRADDGGGPSPTGSPPQSRASGAGEGILLHPSSSYVDLHEDPEYTGVPKGEGDPARVPLPTPVDPHVVDFIPSVVKPKTSVTTTEQSMADKLSSVPPQPLPQQQQPSAGTATGDEGNADGGEEEEVREGKQSHPPQGLSHRTLDPSVAGKRQLVDDWIMQMAHVSPPRPVRSASGGWPSPGQELRGAGGGHPSPLRQPRPYTVSSAHPHWWQQQHHQPPYGHQPPAPQPLGAIRTPVEGAGPHGVYTVGGYTGYAPAGAVLAGGIHHPSGWTIDPPRPMPSAQTAATHPWLAGARGGSPQPTALSWGSPGRPVRGAPPQGSHPHRWQPLPGQQGVLYPYSGAGGGGSSPAAAPVRLPPPRSPRSVRWGSDNGLAASPSIAAALPDHQRRSVSPARRASPSPRSRGGHHQSVSPTRRASGGMVVPPPPPPASPPHVHTRAAPPRGGERIPCPVPQGISSQAKQTPAPAPAPDGGANIENTVPMKPAESAPVEKMPSMSLAPAGRKPLTRAASRANVVAGVQEKDKAARLTSQGGAVGEENEKPPPPQGAPTHGGGGGGGGASSMGGPDPTGPLPQPADAAAGANASAPTTTADPSPRKLSAATSQPLSGYATTEHGTLGKSHERRDYGGAPVVEPYPTMTATATSTAASEPWKSDAPGAPAGADVPGSDSGAGVDVGDTSAATPQQPPPAQTTASVSSAKENEAEAPSTPAPVLRASEIGSLPGSIFKSQPWQQQQTTRPQPATPSLGTPASRVSGGGGGSSRATPPPPASATYRTVSPLRPMKPIHNELDNLLQALNTKLDPQPPKLMGLGSPRAPSVPAAHPHANGNRTPVQPAATNQQPRTPRGGDPPASLRVAPAQQNPVLSLQKPPKVGAGPPNPFLKLSPSPRGGYAAASPAASQATAPGYGPAITPRKKPVGAKPPHPTMPQLPGPAALATSPSPRGAALSGVGRPLPSAAALSPRGRRAGPAQGVAVRNAPGVGRGPPEQPVGQGMDTGPSLRQLMLGY